MFVSRGGVGSENSENLEFADPLNENVTFLRSQGLEHEVYMCEKSRKEKRRRGKKERREAQEK